jgi:NDP-sugar pyrophosphorylase family protein
VKQRETSRYLLFDPQDQLCGRRSKPDLKTELVRPVESPRAFAFSGIHVISPRLLPMIQEEGIFSIISTYLNLAALGKPIMAFHSDEFYWRDLGRPEHLKQAELDLQSR